MYSSILSASVFGLTARKIRVEADVSNMGLTRKSAMEKYLSVIGEVLDMGISPRCHFEDITRADFYGFVLPLAEAIEELCESYGIPVKIS